MAREKVIISRKWSHPEIDAFIDSEKVGASMKLSDFVDALAAEIGSPMGIMTRAQLKVRMLAAASVVAEEMKLSTKYVV
jgi:hypothetical protein